MKTGSVEALIQTTDLSVIYQSDRMELWTLRMMILLISFIHVGQAQAENKPVLIVQPNAPQIFRGENVTLSCIISGGSEQYIWYKDGVHVHSSAEKDYTIKVDQSHRYSCYGSKNGQTTAMSDEVTLSVIERPKAVVILHPDGEIFSGQEVTLTCEIRGHADTVDVEWMYNWYKDGVLLFALVEHKYSFTAVKSFSGKFSCRGQTKSDSQTSETSPAVTLTVSESPKAVVTIKPDTHVFRGETVTLRCEIQGGGDTKWIYSWYKNTHFQYQKPQQFILSSVRNEHSGKYTCSGRIHSDSQSSEISDAVTLTVSDVAETVMTVSPLIWLTEGDSVTLSCEVKHSSTGWTFSWYKDVLYTDSQGSLRSRTSLLSDSSRGSGGSYTLSPVTLNHTGVYVCGAERGIFHTQNSKTQPLWITGESPPVSLIISPSRTQHFTADSLSLSCEDQSNFAGWTVRGYSYTKTFVDCSSVSGSTCNISSLSTSHTGVYWCQSVSGGCSNSVNITVHNGDVILDSPVHPVTEGRLLTLRCLFRNKKIPGSGVDFYKDDSILHSQTTGEMIISSVSKSDEGFYHCKHPERGESPKSWVSVSLQSPGPNIVPVAVAVGLTLALLFIILVLILLWKHKSNKGKDRGIQQNSNQTPVQSPSGAENSQSGNAPLQTGGDNIYASVDNADHDAGPSDVTYAELELKTQKKAKKKQVKANVEPDTLYSELKQDT
ncbi:Fc receptor-like protein 5 isoform X9 [Tachysurus vachellii]|uniref:Fc receptor-like protein 5 isoform X9 n=1 Tax=Tachysurus vachellii TaxID=175792 RepID=UPI00296B0D82|nr:Fc receptor-like protein 5 isoform X9 [Tachysurus vachellii]